MSATHAENNKPTAAPKAGHEWTLVERPDDWDNEYYCEDMECHVKHDCCWCGELWQDGHEDGDHAGVWQEVPKAEAPEHADEQDKPEKAEDADVVEVPVFGAASGLGKRKAEEEKQPEEDKGKEVVDLTSEDDEPEQTQKQAKEVVDLTSEEDEPEQKQEQQPDGVVRLPMVRGYELDLPKGKKARARFDRDVDALVARICGRR